jgi:hypothetical protein
VRIKPERVWHLGIVVLLLWSTPAFGQASISATPTPAPPSALSEVDTVVKIIGAFITGLATLIGLPILFLTYRKTRVEITKLELEANSLREKQRAKSTLETSDEGNIRIVVDNSPYATIEVLADPRFLAPLLILLDFIFAWIVLTLAGHVLSIFGLGPIRTFLLVVFSGLLLLPIARQVLRVRAVLRPPRTPEELRASTQQARIVAYMMYAISVGATLIFGVLMLSTLDDALTNLGRFLAWTFIVCSVLLLIAAPLSKRWLDGYLARSQQEHLKEQKTEV